MAHDSKNAGRKSPVDRSNNDPGVPYTRVPNVIKKEQLTTGEQRAKPGKTNHKKGAY
tara:strand:+ start:872 stop:1042 length:171 start_codon:yes stop_codon:yes gene_type:complete